MRRAAAAVAVLLLVAACGSNDEDTSTPPTLETPTTMAPPTSTTTRRAVKVGAPREVTKGLIESVGAGGTFVIVEDEDPAFPDPGCEGQPEPVLFRVPLPDGARDPLARVDGKAINGRVLPGKDGTVAIVRGCEEFLRDIYIGRLSPGGIASDVRRLPISEPGTDTRVQSSFAVEWSADFQSLLGVTGGLSGAPNARQVVRIDPATGAVTPLFRADGVHLAGELADGRFLTTVEGAVQLRDNKGAVLEKLDGTGFELSPDRTEAAVFGTSLTVVGAGAKRLVARPPGGATITTVAWSPDQRMLAYDASYAPGTEAFLISADGREGPARVAPRGQHGRLVFAADGSAIAFNRFTNAPEFVAKVLLADIG